MTVISGRRTRIQFSDSWQLYMTTTYVDKTCIAAARVFTVATMTEPIHNILAFDDIYVTLADVDGNTCERARLENGQHAFWRGT